MLERIKRLFKGRKENYFINCTFKINGDEIMATLTEIVDGLNTVLGSVQAIDLKLDDIRALIATLRAGAVTQEEIDALKVKVDEIKAAAALVVQEANEAV